MAFSGHPVTHVKKLEPYFWTFAQCSVAMEYGITGCEVFKAGIQNWKRFSIKINCSQMKLLNFENWTNGEPQLLAKIRVLKVYYFDFSRKKNE